MKKKMIWTLSIIATILVLFIIAFIVKKATGISNEQNTYETYKVKTENPLMLQGKASPQTVKSYQNNESMGIYMNTSVMDGQEVEKGQQIINYDTSGNQRQKLVNDMNQAEQARVKAQEAVNQALDNQKAQAQLTEAQANANKASQAMNQFDQEMSDSMYASFSGKIEMMQPNHPNDGETILQLISNNPQIKTTVSEFDLNKIKEGQKVQYTVTSTGEKGVGEVLKISELPTSYEDALGSDNQSSQNAVSASGEEGAAPAQASNPVVNDVTGKDNVGEASKYTVIIGNLSTQVRPGLSLEASVKSGKVKIPVDVIRNGNTVYVLNQDNQVEVRRIKVEKQDGQIYVQSGLREGDRLVKKPQSSLKDGDKVEVKK